MMRILALILLSSLCIITSALSQNVYNDKVKLKNRSVIYGIITAHQPGEYVELLLSGREKIKLYYGEIHLIKEKARLLHFEQPESNGYYNTTEFGFTINKVANQIWWDVEDHYTQVYFSLHTINGYKFSQYLHAGVGIGLDYYNHSKVIPIYLSASGDLLKTRITPVYRLNFGSGIAFHRNFSQWDDTKGGLFFNPALGVKFNKRKGAFLLYGGYRMQKVTLETNQFETLTQEKRSNRNFTFTMGLEF